MLISSLIAAGSANLHRESIDWHNRVITNGGRVSVSTLKAVSNFCYRIDAAGLRDKFIRLNLFCGDNLTAARVPLYRGLSYTGTQYGNSIDTNNNFISGNYIERGNSGGLSAVGDGSQYLDTGLTDTGLDSITNNQNIHLGIYINAMGISASAVIGAGDLCCSYLYMSISSSGGNHEFYVNSDCGSNNSVSPTSTSNIGLFIGSAYPSNSINLYRNGTSLGSATSVAWSSAGNNLRMLVFGVSANDGEACSYEPLNDVGIGTLMRSSGYSIGKGLSSSDSTNYYDAMQIFQSSLGRSV